ncbi:MAG: hypothetical protein IMZ50_03975, partial [Candidatus Atribacteria bacterium]|nr:hypothetical protein [Candidatus Atribacteria bacterium]
TNWTRNLEDLGRTVGAYDTTLHLDVTVKHEHDAREAVEAHRLARLALEDMCRGMLPGPVSGDERIIDVECVQTASQDGAGGPRTQALEQSIAQLPAPEPDAANGEPDAHIRGEAAEPDVCERCGHYISRPRGGKFCTACFKAVASERVNAARAAAKTKDTP